VRFLGISRDAGMSDAIKWAESDDPHDREFAIGVLVDMGISVQSDADQNVFIRVCWRLTPLRLQWPLSGNQTAISISDDSRRTAYSEYRQVISQMISRSHSRAWALNRVHQ
jgi:hypothetical protein